MKNPGIHIFIFTVVLFAAGTSAISYSLAKEAARKPSSLAKQPTPTIPWYCSAIPKQITTPQPQPAKPKTGPGSDNYNKGQRPSTPGYVTPGYTTPGYAPITPPPPAQPPAGYIPGYLPGYFGSSDNAPTDPTITNYESFVALAQTCPSGYAVNWRTLNTTCDGLLRARLEKIALTPADAQKVSACEKKFKPAVWNTMVNKKSCVALRTYKTDCSTSQRRGLPCRSIDGYLVPAGVQLNQINQVARDAALYCDVLYP